MLAKAAHCQLGQTITAKDKKTEVAFFVSYVYLRGFWKLLGTGFAITISPARLESVRKL
jgi:hypothetical protein